MIYFFAICMLVILTSLAVGFFALMFGNSKLLQRAFVTRVVFSIALFTVGVVYLIDKYAL